MSIKLQLQLHVFSCVLDFYFPTIVVSQEKNHYCSEKIICNCLVSFQSRELEITVYWKDWRAMSGVKFLRLEDFLDNKCHKMTLLVEPKGVLFIEVKFYLRMTIVSTVLWVASVFAIPYVVIFAIKCLCCTMMILTPICPIFCKRFAILLTFIF